MWCKQAPESRCRPYIFFFRGLANVLALCIGFAVDTDVFPGSSVVEQLTVNQLVAGSNPARGATLFRRICLTPATPHPGPGMWASGGRTKLIGRMPC